MKSSRQMEDVLAVISDPTRLSEAHDLLAENAYDFKTNTIAIPSDLLEAIGEDAGTNTVASLALQVHASAKPCLVFDPKGNVILANQSAGAFIDAQAGHHLSQLSLRDKDKAALRNLLKDGTLGSGSRQILQIHSPAISRSFTLVLLPARLTAQKPQNRMAVLIDLAGEKALMEQIAQEHALSASEKVVVAHFMAGDRLEDIALSRSRSLTTVKTQFYTIARKFGVKSQTDLLKTLFALSSASDMSESIFECANHPYRREASILRPHGRMVEVILAGDMSGTPVVHIPTLMQKCFPAKTEKMLHDAGILIITIIQPGNGNTSIEPTGKSQRECSCEDITAVLDQLGIETAILFGTATILRSGVLIAQHMTDRICHILISSPTLPSKYEKQFSQPKTFFPVTRKFQALEPGLRNISVRMIWRTITTLRARGMLKIFMRKDKIDLSICLQPETLAEVQAAFDCVIKAGFDRFAQFYEMTFDDWQDVIDESRIPITLYEGSRNRISDSDMLSQFQADHSSTVNLVKYDIAGTCLPYVRPDLMIKMIEACRN